MLRFRYCLLYVSLRHQDCVNVLTLSSFFLNDIIINLQPITGDPSGYEIIVCLFIRGESHAKITEKPFYAHSSNFIMYTYDIVYCWLLSVFSFYNRMSLLNLFFFLLFNFNALLRLLFFHTHILMTGISVSNFV